jgi:hypothetical protein
MTSSTALVNRIIVPPATGCGCRLPSQVHDFEVFEAIVGGDGPRLAGYLYHPDKRQSWLLDGYATLTAQETQVSLRSEDQT